MGWDASARVLGIVRFRSGGRIDHVLDALSDGGIASLEVTLDTPGALEAIERSAGAGRVVGAGTVRSPEEVAAAAGAGSAFVVSPVVSETVIEAANARGVDVLPGAFTPTEVARAVELGATAVKLFPASLGGPRYVRSLRGPFPDVPLVPTGGIAVNDVAAYLDAGASCVGLGGELVGRVAPVSDDALDRIRAAAAVAVAAAAAAPPP
jgi:2-dehydro-3-deoxyphosphogluconate aldolase / (4S)-4-hydroxy-2-oxoglutarate aldolase